MADSFMTYGDVERFGSAKELYTVIRKIDSAFVGANDTISFARKLRFAGVRELEEVQFLIQDPSVEAVVYTPGIIFEEIPAEFSLQQNYPNPFNPSTTISFTLPHTSTVTLQIFNTAGQQIVTMLNNEMLDEGNQEVRFDGSNLASGIYFYRIVAQGIGEPDEGITGEKFVSVKKMVLMK
jgi:hypothetical protein